MSTEFDRLCAPPGLSLEHWLEEISPDFAGEAALFWGPFT